MCTKLAHVHAELDSEQIYFCWLVFSSNKNVQLRLFGHCPVPLPIFRKVCAGSRFEMTKVTICFQRFQLSAGLALAVESKFSSVGKFGHQPRDTWAARAANSRGILSAKNSTSSVCTDARIVN